MSHLNDANHFNCGDRVVKVRGLPYESSPRDVAYFFADCRILNGLNGIRMTLSNQGRPSGQAYIEFESDNDYKKALNCHKKHMGKRYIEVFPSNRREMIKNGFDTPMDESEKYASFVRIRGLPFGSRNDDIVRFFNGLDIARDGIFFAIDSSGKQTGEAYIKFANANASEKALARHKEKMGHRYIEVFRSSSQEYRAVKSFFYDLSLNGNDVKIQTLLNNPYDSLKMPRFMSMTSARSSPYHRSARPSLTQRHIGPTYGLSDPIPSYSIPPKMTSATLPPIGASRRIDQIWNGVTNLPPQMPLTERYSSKNDLPLSSLTTVRHFVHMRGLPYKATPSDIREFFGPLIPSKITILIDDTGRPSGEADVDFLTHGEAEKAMMKDKANMQHRYIELFLHSTPEPARISSVQLSNQTRPQMMQSMTINAPTLSYDSRSYQYNNYSMSPNNHINSAFNNNIFNNQVSYTANSIFRTHDDVLRNRF